MPIYKPSELHQFLNSLGISPKKGLSQNFLIDGNIIRKIISASGIQPGDTVLEIGSGPGSLTQSLLEKQAHVIAVEKDNILADALLRLKNPTNQLDIFCDDILEFSLEEKLEKFAPVKVIANLPYHVTTPILIHLLSKRHLFTSLTLMVQEEVARRFTVSPGTKDYGSITVFLNFYTKPHYAFSVSRNCFYPAPKVDSAVVVLKMVEPPDVDEEQFFLLTRTAFKQRRKMLRSSLKELFGSQEITDALEESGLNPLARPEDLSFQDFLNLYARLLK